MPTYILHGGATSVDSPDNDYFFQQFTASVPKNKVNILMCYWARPEKDWPKLLKRDQPKVLKTTSKKTKFDVVKNPKDLHQKMLDYDVLYVAGGDSKPIEHYYSQLTNLKTLLKNKVYLGSSMGAFLVTKNYVLSLDDQDDKTVHKGVGALPLNALCYWNIETKKDFKLNLLQKIDPNTPIITLDEGKCVQFVV